MVVFADEWAATRALYERCFSRMGFVTLSLDSGPAVLRDYSQWRVLSVSKGPCGESRYADVVVLDADLPGMSGAQVAERLFEEGFHGAVVLLASPERRTTTTASSSPLHPAAAIPLSVAAVVRKPVRMAILRELMHDLVPRARELTTQAVAAREIREATHASFASDHTVTSPPMPPARPTAGGRALQAARISHAARAHGKAPPAAPPRASSSAAFDRALSELGRSGAAATYPTSMVSASAYTEYSATPFPA
jgi:CheY-like chemotaxis protein